ncbi:peroxisomal coenzyme A diphosphatase NUDT7 [Clarias magur]|uniref:Peroxisomal coenzyme A diphosphatase NUDT7 n=1 Tax=Clarias magur TaxID=1594786 RepID=A0A8J4UCY9_CLAMG|nr:peroxisomal coenzyme A diphosphatase NUDT7 [Clarias magur]
MAKSYWSAPQNSSWSLTSDCRSFLAFPQFHPNIRNKETKPIPLPSIINLHRVYPLTGLFSVEGEFLVSLWNGSRLLTLTCETGTCASGKLYVRSQLKHNPGEVCFPGGRSDPHDRDEIDTALREAVEEVSLPPDEVEVICRLCPVLNQRGLLVTPVVAFISDTFQANPNPDEVTLGVGGPR